MSVSNGGVSDRGSSDVGVVVVDSGAGTVMVGKGRVVGGINVCSDSVDVEVGATARGCEALGTTAEVVPIVVILLA